MIALVTDSNSQIPPALADRYGVAVVPLTVTVDGVEHLEGVDLDADGFYERFRLGKPAVSTAHPSPGQFLAAYEEAIAAGADAILSIHIGSNTSGTVNAARLAAGSIDVPVRLVDTGTASFAVSLCVWAAAEAVAAGAGLEEAAAEAQRTAATAGNVFVVGGLDLARAGGRLAAGTTAEPTSSGIPVLTLAGGVMRKVGSAANVDEAADLMAAHIRAGGWQLRVGVGVADAGVADLVHAVEDRLAGAAEVQEVIRYRIGPSVGAHTGPGTVGAMYAPARPT
jgi:DegV family protein with EDD domain